MARLLEQHRESPLRYKASACISTVCYMGIHKICFGSSTFFLPRLWHRTRRSCSLVCFVRAPRPRLVVVYESKRRRVAVVLTVMIKSSPLVSDRTPRVSTPYSYSEQAVCYGWGHQKRDVDWRPFGGNGTDGSSPVELAANDYDRVLHSQDNTSSRWGGAASAGESFVEELGMYGTCMRSLPSQHLPKFHSLRFNYPLFSKVDAAAVVRRKSHVCACSLNRGDQ